MSKILKPGIAAAAVLMALPLALASGRVDAGHRWLAGRRGAWTGTASSYHNGAGNRGGTVTATRPNGSTATASYSRSVSNGTISGTRSATGTNGATRSEVVTKTPGEGRTVTYTGRGGRTYTTAADAAGGDQQ